MVTLALAELLFTLAPTWNSVFGGESGISTMRAASWGLSFGADTDVYYLTLAWFVISAWCMWAFTKTPLGRLALALRDNEHRVRFLGFNTHVARTLIFAISCLFTGVAGALLAIANEATNYTIFSAQASANVVLQTFIGGAGTFFGPALGAAIMTFFARVTSDLTRSWLLYQGLIFVLVMLFAPDGLGGLVSLHARKARAERLAAPSAALSALPRGRPAADRRPGLHRREHPRRHDGRLFRQAPAAKGAWVPYRAVRPQVRAAVARHLGHSRSCCSGSAPCCCRWRALDGAAWLAATQRPARASDPSAGARRDGATHEQPISEHRP